MQVTSVVLQNLPVPSEAQTFFESLTSTEGRAAVTGTIVLLAALIAFLVAPIAVRRVSRATRRRIPTGRPSRAADRTSEVVPMTVSGLLLRTIQIGIVLFVAVSLLVVWGLVGVATDVLTVLGLSIPLLAQLLTTAGLALAAYVASDALAESVDSFATRSDRVTEHQQEIMLRVGNLAIIALVIAGGLTVWGVDLSGLLVGAGFLGIVVGLAARQTLGSLIAGFVLMFSQPFTIGDWVQVGDQEGIVTDITIMNTRLENFDGERIVMPNDRVSDASIINRSERGNLRLRMDVGVDYATDTDHAVEVAQSAITTVDQVTDAPPPRVIPKSFGDSAVLLELRFWIDNPMPPRKWRAIEGVVTAVKEAFEAEDIKIPFPQRELSGRAETGGFRVSEEAVTGPRAERGVEPSPDAED